MPSMTILIGNMKHPIGYRAPRRGTCPSCGGYISLHWGYIRPHRALVRPGTSITPQQKRALSDICLRGKDVIPQELAPILFAISDLGQNND